MTVGGFVQVAGIVVLVTAGAMLLLVGAFGSGGILVVGGVVWFCWLYRNTAR